MRQAFESCPSIRVDFLTAAIRKKALGYDGPACIIDEAINDGSILSQSLEGGDEKLGNSNFLHSFFFFLSFFVGAQWQNPF